MHDDELIVDEPLVASLIADQFPLWSHLALERVDSTGTVLAIYRLGSDMAVRLPLLLRYSAELLKEVEWLPRLAPHLPLATPVPLGLGAAGNGYPSPWAVVTWIEGENATPESLVDPYEAAARLGEFLRVLRNLDAEGVQVNDYRGLPLATRDTLTRSAIERVTNEFDSDAVTEAWASALTAPDWADQPAWFHGDLHSGNLLSHRGRLTAVIDFGVCGVGDPAVDAMAGWWLFSDESREVFRRAGQFDDDTWQRGRGWALSIALIALPYYVETNPRFADMSRRAIREVLRS